MSTMMQNHPYWQGGRYNPQPNGGLSGGWSSNPRGGTLGGGMSNIFQRLGIDPSSQQYQDQMARQRATPNAPLIFQGQQPPQMPVSRVPGSNWLGQGAPGLQHAPGLQRAPGLQAQAPVLRAATEAPTPIMAPPTPAPQPVSQMQPAPPSMPHGGMISSLGGLFGKLFGQAQGPSMDRSLFSMPQNQPPITQSGGTGGGVMGGWQRPMYPQQPPAAMPMQPTGTNPLIGRYG